MILMHNFSLGTQVEEALREAIKISTERREEVAFVFNGTPSIINVGDSIDGAYGQWSALRAAYQKFSAHQKTQPRALPA